MPRHQSFHNMLLHSAFYPRTLGAAKPCTKCRRTGSAHTSAEEVAHRHLIHAASVESMNLLRQLDDFGLLGLQLHFLQLLHALRHGRGVRLLVVER